MKIESLAMIKKYSTYLAIVLSLGAAATLSAQTRYTSQPGANSVRINGTATTHDWEMEGKAIGGFLELGSGVTLDSKTADIAGLQDGKVPAKGRASIIVNSIHAKVEHLPEVMDNYMQQNMKADKFPTIAFNLIDLTPTGTHAAGKPVDLTANGDLVIAGVTNKISLPLSISNVDDSHIKITGAIPLKMTSYGVTPPAPNVLGIGVMSCGDEVKISFDWFLKKAAAK